MPFSVEAFVSRDENLITGYFVDIPEEKEKDFESLYKEQLKVFEWLNTIGHNIAGTEMIRNQLEDAHKNKKFCKIRHILKCYVCSKARDLFSKANV